MFWLLFYGRLEKEKWFDQLVLAIKELNKKKVDFEIFIFWKWSLESQLLEIHDKDVHFFGWKPLDEIKKYLANIDYCLMPSEFLETFGLSALNALSRWVPVIWYKKWWLEPFIFQECNLFLAKWNSTAERIVSIVEKLAKKTNPERIKDKESLEWKIRELLPKYTEDAWYQRFLKFMSFWMEWNEMKNLKWNTQDPSLRSEWQSWNQMDSSAKAVSPLNIVEQKIPPTPLAKGGQWTPEWQNKQKILIISDFINKAGGIETYIHDVKNLLESRWHEVILRWSTLPAWSKWQRKKRFWLLLSPFNFWSTSSLKDILKKENPDIVWFNSLLRWLGPNVVKVAWKWRKEEKSDCKFWMMYHDFGYFYPFPSQLYHIEDCKTPLSLKNFLSAYKWKNFVTKLAVLCKYYWLQPLKKILKKEVDLHLAPSDCITNIARDSYKISEKKCKSFPHFIQK
jgi:glycosyltransferase involved in cell wall biosynthesis